MSGAVAAVTRWVAGGPRPEAAGCASHRCSATHAAETILDTAAAPAVTFSAPVRLSQELGGSGQPQPMRVALASWQQDALHAFWQAQGVRSATQRDKLVALGSAMLLFRSPHDLSGASSRLLGCCGIRRGCEPNFLTLSSCVSVRLAALRQALWHAAGIHDADVGRMVGRYPRVVCGDVSTSVTTKLHALSAGLPGTDLKRLLESNPQLLSLDPESTVVRRAQLLARLLPQCDILRMCELHPALLTVSVERTVAPALAVLTNVLETYGVAPGASTPHRVAQAAPRLLTTAPATLRARAAQLERHAPGTIAAMQDTPAGLGRLLCASERALHRIGYVRAVAPDADLSPVRIVTMPAATFAARFPGWESPAGSR